MMYLEEPREINYRYLSHMEPRPGVSYSTTYVKQTQAQRTELCNHIRWVVTEIADAMELNPEWIDFVQTPLRGFKTTTGQNRSIVDIITDMTREAGGTQRNGDPKDFALAPIERWNKLFVGTEFAITLRK
jgi:hypothetical protein